MSAPTGPATVSAASTTSYGRVLVVGSGDYAGCSLYLLTSDQLHALSGADFACSDNMNVLNMPCDSDLWPALLTKGAPIAGPGVNPRLLGTVTRTDFDLPGVSSVKQVTYAGYPLYRFFLDQTAGDTQGANLDDPVTSPPGIWYLVDPRRGTPATGQAQLQLETAPVGGTGPDATVLAARMNNDFSAFPDASFPVYTLSRGHGHKRGDARSHEAWGHESACQGLCAVYWPPLLTSELPEAGPGVDQHALGIIVRPDGSHQVTYHGRPLYLFNKDAYIGPIPWRRDEEHQRSGCAHPVGRVQHDPAAALEPRPARAHRKPRPTQSTGAFSRSQRNRACAQQTVFPGAASSPHQRGSTCLTRSCTAWRSARSEPVAGF